MSEQPGSEPSNEPSHEPSPEPSSEHGIDPAIVEAVESVANRFGISGLEDLIVEAQRELGVAQAAYAQLAAETD